MLFASLEIEREPPVWAAFPAYLVAWVQIAGGMAAIALVLWSIHYFAEKSHLRQKKLSAIALIFIVLAGLSGVCYVAFLLSLQTFGLAVPKLPPGTQLPRGYRAPYTVDQFWFLTAGGFLALAAVLLPMVVNLARRLRARRIGAIARLSIKEAIRQRIIYAFCLVALVFMFAPYFISYKDEDQLRNYVMLIHTVLAILFLIIAAFLGAFSIPTDVQRQTIHTIVTKPVEKYEIVLGRFLGYGLLLSAVLGVLTLVGLGYLIRGVNPRAAQESYKARVPLFADRLLFLVNNDQIKEKADNVGREWDYRSYIHGKTPGSNEARQYAFWLYQSVPSALGSGNKPVTIELTFDIFRTTKGKEGRGVYCTLTFAPGSYLTHGAGPAEIDSQVEKLKQALAEAKEDVRKKLEGEKLDKNTFDEQLAKENQRLLDEYVEKYGVYREGAAEIVDYHTQAMTIPAGLFRKLLKEQAQAGQMNPGQPLPPALAVIVNVNDDRDSALQYVGMAHHDLYVLSAELPFWQNFIKMMIGLWCNTILVLGVALACSTYLSGVISLLCALFLLCAGLVVDFMRALAAGVEPGGGPYESFNRLVYRLPQAAPLDKTPAGQFGTGVDDLFRWILNYILNLIPDINRFNLTEYVAEGFDISWGQVILLDNVLFLVAYLIPWGILAYYLINYREIANPT